LPLAFAFCAFSALAERHGYYNLEGPFVGIRSLGYYRIGMENRFSKLTGKDAFASLIEKSKQRPVVIFKHSLTCPISSRAYSQMAGFNGEIELLEIQNNRDLSREIEDRLGVEHESPQVIVLRNGQVVWDASHFDVTADAVAEAIRNAEGRKQEQ
jgi:bacillithiol system protein YtxJ